MPTINFEAKPYTIGNWTVLKLPMSASLKFPSRGQVMVKGKINDFPFQVPLEPDGNGSHWLNVDKNMQKAARVEAGETVTLAIESTKDWPEPTVPADVQTNLVDNPQTHDLWMRVTPMARWEWLRWIGSTANPETRKKRIEVSASKLKNGLRRPCCFNRNMNCVPEVSKNGVLLEPAQTTA